MTEATTYPDCEICSLLPTIPASMLLIENEHWNVNLSSQDQFLLGRSYISLKRHAAELDELTAEEERSFIDVRNQLFRAIRRSFHPITFNIACLKNDAFRTSPDTTPSEATHVHWHILPRYGTQPVNFGGDTFNDPAPGRYLRDPQAQAVSPATALAIADVIRNNLD